jgi:hypothetical protein
MPDAMERPGCLVATARLLIARNRERISLSRLLTREGEALLCASRRLVRRDETPAREST